MDDSRDVLPDRRPWRVGRKLGRTIYACNYQPGAEPWAMIASDEDPLIGVMDTPGLARAAVDAHNAALMPWWERPDEP